jgi:hypothetical protein
MTTYFTTQSIFIPSISSSTTSQYSTVFDDLVLQPYDLIRIGSISNPTCTYYNVITSSVGTPTAITLTENAVFLSLRDFPDPALSNGNVTVLSSRSAIVVPYNQTNYTFFTDISNTIGKQFTVTNSTYATTTFTIPSNAYIDITNNYIYIAVSNANVTTIQSNLGTLGNGISTIFSTVNTNALPTMVVTLDRPVTGSGQLDSNFSILRPKPDETSVIINYRKTPGDVSQTILIPQDASDELKSKVGTIFQSLNTDLSNQNTVQ